MLTSKQRAYLRSLAMNEDTIVIIGKGGITENVITQVRDALKARELVKGKVLENSLLPSREACEALAENQGDLVVAGLIKTNSAFVFAFRIVGTENEVVRQVSIGFAPSRVAGDDRCKQSKVFADVALPVVNGAALYRNGASPG